MESSTALLTFKGSIPEAIVEAKKEKKLFLVYISGQDENSRLMKQSTWKNLNVAESVSKYCVFLHLTDGSSDASQFSAIFPQKSVPTISAIGYNGGKLLFHHEGYVSAGTLVAEIEKASASLHMQETAAAILTAAAFSSNRREPSSSSTPNVTFNEKASSSSTSASTSRNSPLHGSEPAPLSASAPAAEKYVMAGEESSSQSVHADRLEFGSDELPISANGFINESVSPVKVAPETSEAEPRFSDVGVGLASEEIATSNANCTTLHPAGEIVTANKGEDLVIEIKSNRLVSSAIEAEDSVQDKNSNGLVSCNANEREDCVKVLKPQPQVINSVDISRSSDVHLNIRLLDGSSLQGKFSMIDTLKSVGDYVDENRSGMGPYDLAIPYPRKVFNEQDMSKTLSELGFVNREALILVPRHSVTGSYRGKSSSHEPTSANMNDSNPSSDNGGGLLGYMKRILSAVNPFSYFGTAARQSSSESASSNDLWQYRPNPGLQNSLAGRPYNPHSSNLNHSPAGETTSKGKKVTPAQFGSNIHTLKHDEDGGPFSDRNAFWNGNSTQYGGDSDK